MIDDYSYHLLMAGIAGACLSNIDRQISFWIAIVAMFIIAVH